MKYALQEGPTEDCKQAVINAALDDQILDLDFADDLNVSLILIDEAS